MADIMRRQFRPLVLNDLQDEINRLFNIAQPSRDNSNEAQDFTPPIDIKNEKDQYLIVADVPGVDPKDIEVTMNDNLLCIKGHKETEAKENKEGFVRVERSRGYFCRQFTLPEAVDSEQISAKSKHGVLEITIPKLRKAASKKIDVTTE